jgi:hypothetical protein
VVLEVPESGGDVEAVVDDVASAAVLPQYLPVLEPVDDVFDAGSDAAVCPVAVVVDCAAGAWLRRGVLIEVIPQ